MNVIEKDLEQILDLQSQEIERVCISTNSSCNLACKYCYFFNPENHIETKPKLSSENILTILVNSNTYAMEKKVAKKIKVNFVGSGEPLLSWNEIRTALEEFTNAHPNHFLRFYTVTNGTLLTQNIVDEMKLFNLTPSISLDGPQHIHDKYRLDRKGMGTYSKVMDALKLLRANGFPIIINTTITYDLLEDIDSYFDFLEEIAVDKVIFDRLVDVPKTAPAVTYGEFYQSLDKIQKIHTTKNCKFEIGNFEAYRRAISGNPDRVCTMFGSTCGAGINNIIYLQDEVYPCGRMFGKPEWLLGKFTKSVSSIQKTMIDIYPKSREDCKECVVLKECIKDCLMEEITPDYDCTPRVKFILNFSNKLSETR